MKKIKFSGRVDCGFSFEKPPVHLLIGGDALDQVRSKLDDLRRETDAWEKVTRSTDYSD